MINSIIKEEESNEEEQEDQNISEKELSLKENQKSKSKEEKLEENNELNLSKEEIELDSDHSLSEYTEDILPKIFSKYTKDKEVKKIKTLIISSNLNLYEKDDEKRTILHRACLQLKLSIVKDLIPKLTSKYINQLDKYGNSPLILACKYTFSSKETNDREKILEILLKHGADIHCIEPINGWTALHWCCFNGDLNCVKLLINYGSNFFLPSKYGFFTIDLAGKKLFYELVSFLIKTASNYLQKVGEYELLDVDYLFTESSKNNILKENFKEKEKNNDKETNKDKDKKTSNIARVKTFVAKKDKNLYKNKNYNDDEKSDIKDNYREKDFTFRKKALSGDIKPVILNILDKNVSDLPKINQTVYLRLFTEHCLYWACFFNFSEKIINMFLSLYNTRPAFPLFSLDNKTALHAACIQGSFIPFQLVYKTNELRRKRKLEQDIKSEKIIPVTLEENDLNYSKCIKYPAEFNQYKKKFLSSAHYNSFSDEFKNYLNQYFFNLIYPKTLMEKLPISQIFDKDKNTPITLACKYNNQNFIKNLLKSELIEDIHEELKPDNNLGYSGYYYLKNSTFKRKFLEEAGKGTYIIPPVVLELNKNPKTMSSINLIMKIAINEGLIVALMQKIDDSKVYLLIDINEELFYKQAEIEKIEMKLLDKNLLLKFENNKNFIDIIEPFFSRHYQYIIIKCISNCLDTEMLKNQKILNQIFLTHMPNITTKIYSTIIKHPIYALNPLCYFFDYFLENKNCTYSYIKLLHAYFGESISMFYAFYAYLTNMYILLAIASISYCIYYGSELFTAQDIYPSFFIIFIIWNIVILIKWRRKCNEIQEKWGLKVSSDSQIIRPEFHGDEYYTDLDAPLEKHVSKYDSFISFFITLPFIILLLGADILVFYFTTKWEDLVKTNEKFWFRYVPSIVRSLALVIVAKIYDMIAVYSTRLENRKQEDIYEMVMGVKVFIFRLISDFTAVIYSAMVTRDIYRLKTLLYTHIVIKYLSEIGGRFVYPFLWHYFLKKYYFKKVDSKAKLYPIKKEDKKTNAKEEDKTTFTNKLNNKEKEKFKENDILKINKVNLTDNPEKTEKALKTEENPELDIENTIYKDIKKDKENNKEPLRTLSKILSTHELYNRVSIISNNKGDSKIFDINPDFIELQKTLIDKSAIYYDYADVLITHVLISLFAIIIPFAPLICFVFQIMSQNARLYIDIFCLKRPTPLSCKNIKIWNQILQINNIIMSFTNCFLYYFYGTNNFFVGKKTANKIEIMIFSVEESFFGIICAEHLFIMINFLAQKLISDIPEWVRKEKENLIGYYQIMSLDKKKKENLELELKVEKYKNNIKELIHEKKIQMEKINSFEKNLDIILKQISFNQKKIEQYDEVFEEIKENQKLKTSNRFDETGKLKIYNKPKIKKLLENKIEKYNIEQMEHLETEKILTTSISQEKNEETNIFLSSKIIKKNINIKIDKSLEKAIKEILNENKINILTSENTNTNIDIIEIYFDFSLKKIFDFIEKIIFSKKLEYFLKNNRTSIVVCNSCSKNKGLFMCEQCSDILCSICKENHDKNDLWKDHTIKVFNLPMKQNLIGRDIIYGLSEGSAIPFIKGEYFLFPVSTYQNYGFTNLQKIFDFFYKYYLTYNGINQNNSLSLKEFMQYRLEYFTEIEAVPEQAFKNDLETMIENSEFNLTEIFFINRICFKNFKYFGAKVTIDKIFEPLKKIQCGEFEDKLKILLNILDIYDNKIILREEMDKFLTFCLYQNYLNELSQEKIIENLYPLDAKFVEYSSLYSSIIYKKNIYQVFYFLLQCENKEENSDEE